MLGRRINGFQLTAARRRLESLTALNTTYLLFQLTAARRRLDPKSQGGNNNIEFQLTAARRRLAFFATLPSIAFENFNSQPREGGWLTRRLIQLLQQISTHSRAKAAGYEQAEKQKAERISTHSRAKAAGKMLRGLSAWVKFQLTAARRRLDLCKQRQR